jgi:hypothetical protein
MYSATKLMFVFILEDQCDFSFTSISRWRLSYAKGVDLKVVNNNVAPSNKYHRCIEIYKTLNFQLALPATPL